VEREETTKKKRLGEETSREELEYLVLKQDQ
jgi:hypothetical protein